MGDKPRSGGRGNVPDLEGFEHAEKTVRSAVPVFDDEAPTPVPAPPVLAAPVPAAPKREHVFRPVKERVAEPRSAPDGPRRGLALSAPEAAAPSPEAAPRRLVLPKPGKEPAASAPLPRAPPSRPPSEVPIPERERVPLGPAVVRLEPEPLPTGRYLFVGSAAVVVLIAGLFAWGARRDAVSPSIDREEGRPAGTIAQPAVPRSYKDEYRAQNPDTVVRSPLASAVDRPVLGASERAVPVRERRGGAEPLWKQRYAELQRPDAPKPVFAFEVPPNRSAARKYDNEKESPFPLPFVMVFSYPTGMNVEVDGRRLGKTPFAVPVAEGTKSVMVKVSGAGFKAQNKSVSKGESGNLEVGFVMEPLEVPPAAPPG